MSVQTGANCKIYIGTTAAHANQAAYEADTYTLVEQTESIGDFGDNYAEVTFTGLEDARVQKKKGAADAGNLSVTMAFDGTAFGSPLGGQGVLTAASEDTTSSDYNFKVVFNDGTTGSPLGDGTTRYFSGQVATMSESISGADNILMVTAEVRINTSIIKVVST